MFEAPPPPDNFKEGLTIKYTPPSKQEEYNPFGRGEPIPDSLATTLDQVLSNHMLELNLTQKEYSEIFSGASLFDWSDKDLLQKYNDNFDMNRKVYLCRDSVGNFFMLFDFEEDKNLSTYKINNVPANLVEKFFSEASILSNKKQSATGFIIFEQKFPEFIYGISGDRGLFPADNENIFPYAATVSVVESRDLDK